MKKTLPILIFLIFTLFSCNTNNSPNSTVIVYNTDTVKKYSFIVSPNKKLIFVKVILNNKETYFLMDTGATQSVLDISQEEYFGFNGVKTNLSFGGIGGSNALYLIVGVDSFKINNNTFDHIFYGSDIKNVSDGIKQLTGIQIAGILGSDFFTEHNVIFDYGNDVFIIEK